MSRHTDPDLKQIRAIGYSAFKPAMVTELVDDLIAEVLELREYVRKHNEGWLAPRTRVVTLGNAWADGTPIQIAVPEEKKDP